MAKSTNSPTITINPMFKLLLWINGALCAVTLGVMIWIAASAEEPMPKARERLMNACEHPLAATGTGERGLRRAERGAIKDMDGWYQKAFAVMRSPALGEAF